MIGICLTDLNWRDILFPSLLPLLSVQDLFSLRAVNITCYELVSRFLEQNRKLNLENQKKLTERAFQVLTLSAQSLRYINFSGSKVVTDDLLRVILTQNPQLSYINLSNCQHCTSGVLQIITIKNRNVEHLILENCHWVSRDAIEYHSVNEGNQNLSRPSTNLKEINFTGCWELSDDVLVPFLARFPRIQVVKLGKIYSLTDKILMCLAGYNRNLRVLDIQGCWRMTNVGLRMLGEYCRELRTLQVADCRDITEESLSRFREKGVNIDRPVDTTLLRLRRLRDEYLNHKLPV